MENVLTPLCKRSKGRGAFIKLCAASTRFLRSPVHVCGLLILLLLLLLGYSRAQPLLRWGKAHSRPVRRFGSHGLGCLQVPPTARNTASSDALLIMAARGGHIADPLMRQLLSVQRFMPKTAVALIVDEPVSAALWRYLEDQASGSEGPLPSLRIRVYSWDGMTTRLPPEMSNWMVNEQRMLINSMIIADFQAGGSLHTEEVLWQLGMDDCAAFPQVDVVGLIDARDTMFQGDIWEPLWREVEADRTKSGSVAGSRSDALPPILVVSAEARSKTIGSCPYNSGWINKCYGQAAASAVSGLNILCSGVIVGTVQAVASYMTDFMVPACINCMEMKGWEQGPHNFLLHYAAAETSVREKVYGALASDPAAAPTIGLAERLAASMRVIVEPAEGEWLCTVGYLKDDPTAAALLATSTADGLIPSVDNPSKRCRAIHQFDRFDWMSRRFDTMFPLPHT